MVDRFARFSLAINEIYRYWHQLTSEEMAEYGLKGPHCTYLLHISRNPEGLTATQLCELCGKDKADVSRTMAFLEEKGMVTKEGFHQNLYRGVYKLTDDGRKAAEHVRRRASLAVEIAGKDMNDETRAIFYDGLESITENLRRLSKSGLPEEE